MSHFLPGNLHDLKNIYLQTFTATCIVMHSSFKNWDAKHFHVFISCQTYSRCCLFLQTHMIWWPSRTPLAVWRESQSQNLLSPNEANNKLCVCASVLDFCSYHPSVMAHIGVERYSKYRHSSGPKAPACYLLVVAAVKRLFWSLRRKADGLMLQLHTLSGKNIHTLSRFTFCQVTTMNF